MTPLKVHRGVSSLMRLRYFRAYLTGLCVWWHRRALHPSAGAVPHALSAGIPGDGAVNTPEESSTARARTTQNVIMSYGEVLTDGLLFCIRRLVKDEEDHPVSPFFFLHFKEMKIFYLKKKSRGNKTKIEK